MKKTITLKKKNILSQYPLINYKNLIYYFLKKGKKQTILKTFKKILYVAAKMNFYPLWYILDLAFKKSKPFLQMHHITVGKKFKKKLVRISPITTKKQQSLCYLNLAKSINKRPEYKIYLRFLKEFISLVKLDQDVLRGRDFLHKKILDYAWWLRGKSRKKKNKKKILNSFVVKKRIHKIIQLKKRSKKTK